MKELEQAIYKRRSMRNFDENRRLTAAELQQVTDKLHSLTPLCADIAVDFEIVPCAQTNCKFNAEYCVLCYSESKPFYLENIGYMLEQWDLYCALLNIGVCWYGMGKVKQTQKDGKVFVIMLCFGKSSVNDFRLTTEEFNRKSAKEIWNNSTLPQVAEICRLAPSAVNSQPWRVEQLGDTVKVYRKLSDNLLLARHLFKYFNKIDIGIFLTYLEIGLESVGSGYFRTLHPDVSGAKNVLTATYTLTR